MRNLPNTIDLMLSEIPEAHSDLRLRLLSIKKSSSFAAPEIQVEHWRNCYDVLIDAAPEPTLDWEVKVANIFADKSPV